MSTRVPFVVRFLLPIAGIQRPPTRSADVGAATHHRLHGMYRCQICGEVSSPRTPAQTLAVETRERAYPVRKKVVRPVRRVARCDKQKEHWNDDPGGTGREIVRELRVCLSCKLGHPASP